MSGVLQKRRLSNQRPKIEPNCFYRLKEIESMFGINFIRTLWENGLCAVSDWYSGKQILEAYQKALNKIQEQKSQRVPERKEGSNNEGHRKEVEKGFKNNRIQSISKPKQSDSLGSQLQEIQQLRET